MLKKIIVLLTLITTIHLHADETEQLLKQAHDSYLQGEKAQTIAERKQAFNQALTAYTTLEKEYHPTFGNGKLYYDLANTYFQLEEYPHSVLNYYRAKKLMPRDTNANKNLLTALEKLGVANKEDASVFKELFFFHFFLSLPERLQIFSLLTVILTILFAISLVKQLTYSKIFIIFTTIFWIVMLVSLLYSRYLDPIEGVLVNSTSLYRDAGEQYAKVSDEPVLSGTKVQVLDQLQQGQWLKVLTPDGNLGFIPQATLRVI